MSHIGRAPCDEGVIRSKGASAPCPSTSAPWVLAATVIGSAMVFIDGTVVKVALPQIQDRLDASAADARTSDLDLPPEARQQLEAEKSDLGGAEPPTDVDAATAARIERAVDEAFVAGFRATMIAAAVLALASALVAALVIEGKRKEAPPESAAEPAAA